MGAVWTTIVALGIGLTVFTIANGVAGPGNRRGAPPFLRGLTLVWLAISLAMFVLGWLDGFQRSDRILLLVMFGIVAALAALDRGVAHLRGGGVPR
jgi:hypothetical protein